MLYINTIKNRAAQTFAAISAAVIFTCCTFTRSVNNEGTVGPENALEEIDSTFVYVTDSQKPFLEEVNVKIPEPQYYIFDSAGRMMMLDTIDVFEQIKERPESEIITDSFLQVKDNLIEEVALYINKNAPKSRMSAVNIVELCLKNEFDISLLMSQAHQETHFGTTGRNVFGIYGKRYAHPDSAVLDYINLIKSRYIINRSTEEFIASGMTYENNRKAKYAGDPNYPHRIHVLRSNIVSNTNIYTLYNNLLSLNKKKAELEQKF